MAQFFFVQLDGMNFRLKLISPTEYYELRSDCNCSTADLIQNDISFFNSKSIACFVSE